MPPFDASQTPTLRRRRAVLLDRSRARHRRTQGAPRLRRRPWRAAMRGLRASAPAAANVISAGGRRGAFLRCASTRQPGAERWSTSVAARDWWSGHCVGAGLVRARAASYSRRRVRARCSTRPTAHSPSPRALDPRPPRLPQPQPRARCAPGRRCRSHDDRPAGSTSARRRDAAHRAHKLFVVNAVSLEARRATPLGGRLGNVPPPGPKNTPAPPRTTDFAPANRPGVAQRLELL